MRTPVKTLAFVCAVIAAGLVFGNRQATADELKSSPDQTHPQMTITPDGKFVTDSSGKKVKQYLDSVHAFVPMTAESKSGTEFNPVSAQGEGHTFYPCNCRSECIAWNSNGVCTRTYRTCDICSREN